MNGSVARRGALTLGAVISAPAFAVAVFATDSVPKALAVSVACVVAPLVATTPLLALVALACVNISGLADSVPFAATFTLLGAYAAIAYLWYCGELRVRWSPVYLGAGVFVASDVLSILDASSTSTALSQIGSNVRDLLSFAAIVVLLTSVQRFRAVAWCCVLTMAGLTGLTVVHEFLLHNHGNIFGLSGIVSGGLDSSTARHLGPLEDPNFWARVVILSVPLALSVAAFERRWLRAVALIAVVYMVLGIILTQSRGGMIGLGVAVVLWLLLAGGRYARLLFLAPIVLNLLLVAPLTGPRLDTIINRGSDTTVDVSIEQRKLASEIGVDLFERHPVLGIGVGNFAIVAPDLAPDISTEKSTLLATHDLYLERLAEGGVVGLSGWLVFLGTALFALTRARVLFTARRSGARSIEEWLTIGAFAGIIGWSAASAFLHMAVFRSLLVVFAFAAALDITARIRGESALDLESQDLDDEATLLTP